MSALDNVTRGVWTECTYPWILVWYWLWCSAVDQLLNCAHSTLYSVSYLDIKLSLCLNIMPWNIQVCLCPSIMPWTHLGGGCKDWRIVNRDANQLLKISLHPVYFKCVQTHQRHVYRFSVPQNVTGHTNLCVQWVPGTFSARVKRLGCEADPSPPYSDEVRNE